MVTIDYTKDTLLIYRAKQTFTENLSDKDTEIIGASLDGI